LVYSRRLPYADMCSNLLISTLFYCLLCLLTQIRPASAAPTSPLEHRDDKPIPLPESATKPYLPYIYLSGAAYCHIKDKWNCGDYCDHVPDFQVTASGGDGCRDPHWYAGYAPSIRSIVVGHQGTNTSSLRSILNDFNIKLEPLPADLFPGAPSGAEAHRGFLEAMSSSASAVLTAVRELISSTNATQVAVVGHSLGAATATLSGISLKLQLPSTISVKVVSFGTPRVMNPTFADFTDSLRSDFHHITNKRDGIPLTPLRRFGYAQPDGELHISKDEVWFSCPGHDNPSKDCSAGAVPHLWDESGDDHLGPYLGVILDSEGCPNGKGS